MKRLIQFLLICAVSFSVDIDIMFAQSAEQTFQQAVILEEAQGDLEGAIDLYTALAEDASAERSLRARALLKSGLCYEKLGRKNAIRVYEKLVSEFQIKRICLSWRNKNFHNCSRYRPLVKG